MDQGRDDRGSSGTQEPSLVVPDSVGLVVSPAASAGTATTGLSENKPTPSGPAGFVNHSLPVPSSGPFSATKAHGEDRPAIPVGLEDGLAVLSADLLGLLGEHNNNDEDNPPSIPRRTGDTPHAPGSATTLRSSRLAPPSTVDNPSPGWSSQPARREHPAEDPRPSYNCYSSAFENLAREVSGSEGPWAGSAASRPSLCACKKLAVPAMLDGDRDGADGGGVGGTAALRPGRVCPNRGREADCFYQAYADAPLVPSTTVSHKTLSLVVYMHQSGANGELRRKMGGVARADACGVTGGFNPEAGGAYEPRKVPVEIRRWLMDGVASVHCADATLRGAFMRLIPPTLGQMHLSPDGSGQLIAVHIAAVPLLVQEIATIPGVSRIQGTDKFAQVFPSQQSSGHPTPTTTTTTTTTTSSRKNKADAPPKAAPVAAAGAASTANGQSARFQKPAAGGSDNIGGSSGTLSHGQFNRRPMVAPVPVRASDMVSPSMWDLANLEGDTGGDSQSVTAGASSGLRPGVATTAAGAAALVTSSSSPPFVSTGAGGESSANGRGQMMSVVARGGGVLSDPYCYQTAGASTGRGDASVNNSSGAAMMMAANTPLFSTTHDQVPAWENTPTLSGVGLWPQAAKIARGGADGFGSAGGQQVLTDSAVSSASYGVGNINDGSITITTSQEHQPDSSYGKISSSGGSGGSSSSSSISGGGGGFCAGQYNAETVSKRQRTSSVVASQPVSSSQPNGPQELQGYASLFGGVGGYAAAAAPPPLPENMLVGVQGGGLACGEPNMLGDTPGGTIGGGYGADGGASLGVLDANGGGSGGLGAMGFGAADGGSGFGSGVDGDAGVGEASGGVEIGSAWVDAVFDAGPPTSAGASDGVSMAPSSYLW